MKFTDIQNREIFELQAMLKAEKLKQFEMGFKHKTMQLQNTSELRAVKKDIARILTAINNKNKVGI